MKAILAVGLVVALAVGLAAFVGTRGSGDVRAEPAPWTFARSMSQRRSYMAAAKLDGNIYAVGGMVGETGRFLAVAQRFDPRSNSWTGLPRLPEPTRAAAGAALGNQVGLMVVPLPVGEPVEIERLRRITRATGERKRRPEVLASLRPVGSLTVLRALNRYSSRQRIVDLFTTNVPGPRVPLYLLGARLLEAFPIVPLAGNVTLSVAVLSYDGQLNISIQSDPDAIPDLGIFVNGLRRSLDELAAGRASGPGVGDPPAAATQLEHEEGQRRADHRAAQQAD